MVSGCNNEERIEISVDPRAGMNVPNGAANQEELLIDAYKRLGIIYGLAQSFLKETNLDGQLDIVISGVSDNLSAERCMVGRTDRDGKITPLRVRNIEQLDATGSWPISTTIVQRVVDTGRAILSADAIGDRQLEGTVSVHVQQIRSVICAPLGQQDARNTFIYLDNRSEVGSFTEADLYFVTTLSQFLSVALINAERIAQLRRERELTEHRLTAMQEEIFRDHQIVGRSEVLLQAYRKLRLAAQTDIPLLLYGETGTGKELFAKAAHQLSKRNGKPFVSISIAALSETLVESEMFGHAKGAFTGAVAERLGRFELADGGTLFLDEVAEIPLNIQSKLLRILESGELERVGGTKSRKISVRLICATHKRLDELVESGSFREDLYWRLMGVTINLPPLRERPDDIPELITHFLRRLHSTKHFTQEAISAMQHYRWPGNIRQLCRLVEEIDAICERDRVDVEDLPSYMLCVDQAITRSLGDSEIVPLDVAVEELERSLFKRALSAVGGNHERAMKLLGVSRSKYFGRKKAFGL